MPTYSQYFNLPTKPKIKDMILPQKYVLTFKCGIRNVRSKSRHAWLQIECCDTFLLSVCQMVPLLAFLLIFAACDCLN